MGKDKEKVQNEILEMAERDQNLGRDGTQDVTLVIREHSERIRDIIQEYGWPDTDRFGEKVSEGAWLLVQHSDHDVAFQEWVLNILRSAVENGVASARHVAYLTDRIAVNKGEAQTFGTQFQRDDKNNLTPYPIFDEKDIDKRRAQYGLETFAEYTAKMNEYGK